MSVQSKGREKAQTVALVVFVIVVLLTLWFAAHA
jgi:hypothetical protein